MRPKLPTNAAAYLILSLAGAGSFLVPADLMLPASAAQTIPADTTTADSVTPNSIEFSADVAD